MQPRSIRSSDAGPRDRAQEPPLGLGALRPLRPARPGDGGGRVHLPRGRLTPAGIFLARPEPLPATGIRLAVKDLFDTAGLTTTYGSAIFADHVPGETAEAVERLEAAGYANVGKTNLHEFAYGTTSENPHYGNVPNPIAPGRIAGGSSGGSAAALAAGLAEAALGSDTGGSIRIPAACCGITGFKPTFGLVPRTRCFPLAPSLDHAGPMALSVDACAEMMSALAPGFEPARLESLEEVAVGVAWTDGGEPLVGARVEEAAANFPRLRRIDLPLAEEARTVFMREVADVHRELYAEHAELYSDNVAAKLERCLAVTDGEYEAGVRGRERYREQFEEAMDGLDLLVTPTLRFVAPPAGQDEKVLRADLTRFTWPFNVLGAPALAIPCGPAEDGLPASLQLVGRPGADALVLAAGARLQHTIS
ncbi:MAG TPA: amidase [Gaiellaceae bacterium]|nr:amidase [Gaiellaceae bacterium]